MKIKFHYSLIILFTIFLFSGLFIEILIFFLIITAHECGHLFALKLFKQKVHCLNLTIVGGILEVEREEIAIIKEIIINLSGVIINVLIYFGIIFLPDFPYKPIILNYNLLMICFNLLPIYPLDGFNLFESIFKFINDPFKEQKILNTISILTLFGIFILLILKAKSFSVIILFIFLIFHNLVLKIKTTEIALKKYVKRYNYLKETT